MRAILSPRRRTGSQGPVAVYFRSVVGRVHGAALGGGAGLGRPAIPVAALGTQFGFTEARLGILPAVISPCVPRKTGESAALAPLCAGLCLPVGGLALATP